MSKIALTPNPSGTATFTLASPATSTDRTITLPDVTTTLVGTDATQTLTNKTIASSQLTGALPAIDGSALTGIATGSLTLLGTIATTSGTSVTLSGLTLTSYKQLCFVMQAVSGDVIGRTLMLNGISLGATTAGALTDGMFGGGTIDLNSSAYWGLSRITDSAFAHYGSAFAFSGYSAITTASTSITFTMNANNFDAGSIRIYGVK